MLPRTISFESSLRKNKLFVIASHLLMEWKRDNLLISLFFLLVSYLPVYSQTTFNRYIFTHPNRKNDSQIKPSPLAMPDNNSSGLEFNYKSVPSKGMEKKVKRIFGNSINEEDDADFDLEDYYFDNSSIILEELEEEANKKILKQRKQTEQEIIEKQKMNIASFTAQIKARKKREEEKNISEQELEETETAELTNNTQSDIPQSYEISVGSDGKVKLKSFRMSGKGLNTAYLPPSMMVLNKDAFSGCELIKDV